MHILNNETEAPVRSEAATLMKLLYKHQKLPEELMDHIYEMMAFSATIDLNGEVRRRALEFWDEVIWEHLKCQGMIDGSFPKVTFSKENRKIVTLTEVEIRRRLHKVLIQLSENGCLGVLISAIQDDCDMEVVKQAVTITKKFVELLRKHGGETTPNVRSPTTSISSDSDLSPQFRETRSSSVVSVNSQSTSSSVKIITPFYFLEFVNQDLDKTAENKRNWLNGVDSFDAFIDDMLKQYEAEENGMDCY